MGVLVGKPAPNFNAKAVINGNQVVDSFELAAYHGQYVVLFFYPFDFTFVCPTELHAFQDCLPQFEARNTQVMACSTDSWFSHLAWLTTPKAKGGIEGVTYPLIADFNKTIATDYDVLITQDGPVGASYRGLFLIDRQGIVRHQLINDTPLGRSTDEVLRLIDALQYFEQNGEVCPANWKEGKQAMQATRDGVEAYFSR